MSQEVFTRIEHNRTADEVVHQIEILVLDGVLRVGDRLPGERELSRQFDVSRPILRVALKTLEARGLLISRHGGGTYIADLIGQVFSPPLMDLITRHQQAIHDYLEYRRGMEGMTAALAAQRATSADKELLTRTIADMKAAHEAGDFERETAIDVEFHNAVSECAHNIILLHTLRSCYRLLSEGVFFNRSLVYNFPGARDRLLEQHLEIYDAIVSADPDRATAASHRHIDFVTKSMIDAQRTGAWEKVSHMRLHQRGLSDTIPTDKTNAVRATKE